MKTKAALIILSRHFYVSVAHIIAEINGNETDLAAFANQPNFIYVKQTKFRNYEALAEHILLCNSNPNFLRETSLSCLANLHDGPRRLPPTSVFRRVQRKLDGEVFMYDDSGESHEFPHRRVGKPLQLLPQLIPSSIENNACRIPLRPLTADALSLEHDKLIETQEKLVAKQRAVQQAVELVNCLVRSGEATSKICLGKLSILDGQKFCKWCFDKHHIRASQDSCEEYCEELFAVYIPAGLDGKVVLSIRAKFRRFA